MPEELRNSSYTTWRKMNFKIMGRVHIYLCKCISIEAAHQKLTLDKLIKPLTLNSDDIIVLPDCRSALEAIKHEDSRSYVECRYCPSTQLNPKHLFNCPSIIGALFKKDYGCSMDILYSDRAMDVATAVIYAFGKTSDYILMFYYYNLCTLSYTTTTTTGRIEWGHWYHRDYGHELVPG
ncbi:RNase H domain-containing protein [Trichonephila clavipes]|nr:RNase H domain-containing protein [Trichonephila clavipes]